ncbi:hypothetical protein ACIBI4_05435 [Streptomyces sp. NPDC050418]|uniref:hypothetical protein n=1 Tax=Streptomyces sp. NPDC050418 TaxID=3365612 RepID=UPI0037BC745C
MSAQPTRFRDPRTTRYDYLVRSVLVRCPACARQAQVVRVEPARDFWGSRRLSCTYCGLSRTTAGGRLTFTGRAYTPTDPWFGVPLWLSTRTRHGTVWAYHHEHLTLIRSFVAASLRERAPWYERSRKMTVVARLPRWMTKAGNRDEVLRAIDRIRRGAPR